MLLPFAFEEALAKGATTILGRDARAAGRLVDVEIFKGLIAFEFSYKYGLFFTNLSFLLSVVFITRFCCSFIITHIVRAGVSLTEQQ